MRNNLDTRSVARLAAALARTPEGARYSVEEVARDAVTIILHALALRNALRRQRPRPDFDMAAGALLSKYGAIREGEPHPDGAAVALRFAPGVTVSGFRNLFFVA